MLYADNSKNNNNTARVVGKDIAAALSPAKKASLLFLSSLVYLEQACGSSSPRSPKFPELRFTIAILMSIQSIQLFQLIIKEILQAPADAYPKLEFPATLSYGNLRKLQSQNYFNTLIMLRDK